MRPTTKQTRRKIKGPRKTRKQLLGGDKYFHFWRTDNDRYHFDEKLKSVPCKGRTLRNANCKRKVIIGTPYCKDHLRSVLKLSIRNSLIPNAGKGLFADERGAAPGDIVFHAGDPITPYEGKRMSKLELNNLYGRDQNVTAPYAIEREYSEQHRGSIRPRSFILDGATDRGIANLANQAMNNPDNNAKLHEDTAALVAIKDILQGEEILTSYGQNYRFDGPGKYSTNQCKLRREGCRL